jgi:hypothetical protein
MRGCLSEESYLHLSYLLAPIWIGNYAPPYIITLTWISAAVDGWHGHCPARTLAPLKACKRLAKLDIRGGWFVLHEEFEDLHLVCNQLADPQSVELEGRVHDMHPSIPPDMQWRAARHLATMSQEGGFEVQTAIADAGAIPKLVQLLGPEFSADVQRESADALGSLALGHIQNNVSISLSHVAGAIPALRALLRAWLGAT